MDGEDGASGGPGKDTAKPLGKPVGKLKLGTPAVAGVEKSPSKDANANATAGAGVADRAGAPAPVPEPETDKNKEDKPVGIDRGITKDANGKVGGLAKPPAKLKLGSVGVGATARDGAKDVDAVAEAPETPESLEAT